MKPNNSNSKRMKTKYLRLPFILLAIFSASIGAYSQKPGSPFKGVITYQIAYPEGKIDASQQNSMPKTLKVSLNGNKSRIDMNMNALSQIVLMDAEAKTTTVLLDLMGTKVAMKPNKRTDLPAKEPVIKIIPGDVKEIAGFACKKAEIQVGGEKSTQAPTIVYFTDAIGNNQIFYDNEFAGLQGIPMEFDYKMQGMNLHLVAISVEKTRISNREFEVPSDYKEVTPEELRQMFGGGK